MVHWRRRHPDFPVPVAGTDIHPQFDLGAVVAWLLAHDKIDVPVGPTVASLVVAWPGGATRQFRFDDLWLFLSDDAAGEDCLSGWSTDDDADALAELAAGERGASVRRLADRARYRPVGGSGRGPGDRAVPVGIGWSAADAGVAGRIAGSCRGGVGGRGDPARG